MQYSFELNYEQVKQLINKFESHQQKNTTKYMIFRAKINDSMLTIYTTNKITIQGNDATDLYNQIADIFGLKKSNHTLPINNNKEQITFDFSIIGTDEVGTGDYFGPIIVCACFVPKNKILDVTNLGVTDSKKISDKKILSITPKLIKNLTYSVVSLSNKKYNEVSKTANMNKVKALMHNEAINKLLTYSINYDRIIVDGFTTTEKYYEYLQNKKNVNKDVELITGGEDKFIAIAAASVIARYYFLKAMDELSIKYNYKLPKGAGKPVDEVLSEIVRDNNKDLLIDIAKVNFKNTTKIKL